MHDKHSHPRGRLETAGRVVVTTIALNSILTFFKLFAGFLAGSTAMVADALHSASDILSSVGVIIGIRIARKPRDVSHPYGHDKAESIAAILLASILIATGGGIGWSAVISLFKKSFHVPGAIALYAAIFSIIVKEGMYRYTVFYAKRINSSALAADAWHHRSDALSSIGALAGIGGARLGYTFMDPLAGFVVSVLVLKAGVEVFIKAYYELMDTSASPEMVRHMEDITLSVEGVENITELKTRQHGSGIYVDLKICVDRHIPVYRGHEIAHRVEDAIMERIEEVKDVLVHVDPCHNAHREGKREESCSGCEWVRNKLEKDGN